MDHMATDSSILVWRIPIDRGAWQATVNGIAKHSTAHDNVTFLKQRHIIFHDGCVFCIPQEFQFLHIFTCSCHSFLIVAVIMGVRWF